MILIYRPELDNPPMDKEATIGFSFIGEGANTEYISINSGVHRDFPETVWQKIQNYPVVKNLLALGALAVRDDEEITAEPAAPTVARDASIASMPLVEAMELIEASMDPDQLRRWDSKDQRIRVKNAIAKRLTALTEGNG